MTAWGETKHYGPGRLGEQIALMMADPDREVRITFNDIQTGWGMRRNFLAIVNSARVHGVEVELHEARGLFGSTFAMRASGKCLHMAALLTALKWLEG